MSSLRASTAAAGRLTDHRLLCYYCVLLLVATLIVQQDVPQRFQDMYTDTLPLPTHLDAPSDLPDVAYYSCTSVNGRSDVGGQNCNDTTLNPEGCSYIMPNASYAKQVGLQRTPPQLMRKIRAGYAGGITWTDLQIGKVLDALEATGKAKDTLVMYLLRPL
jgi:arylsulfatase A-like enzyme